MIIEEQRYLLEDLERLEQGIADRVGGEEPKLIRDRLNRDHEVGQLLNQIQRQSADLLTIYRDENGLLSREIQQLGSGDTFEGFYKQVDQIRQHHARYPNEQAENSESRYNPKGPEDSSEQMPYLVDSMFSGEEGWGRYFDLHLSHEAFLNLPNVKRLTYLQYLDVFDNFAPGVGAPRRSEKLTDQYFKYVGDLAAYLESFLQRTRPLDNFGKVFAEFDREFDEAWEKDEVPNWQTEKPSSTANAPVKQLAPGAVWCEDCEKEFKSEGLYKGHLSGRKHIKAAEQRAQRLAGSSENAKGTAEELLGGSAHRLKERAVAEREWRVSRLVKAMNTERNDTKVNVERRQTMTQRERQQELDELMNMAALPQIQEPTEEEKAEGEDKVYNPLKLPLAWDGQPIPFWLYRLHGLGVEFPCEICGHWTYNGRRAYEKHFNESRHIHGLKCLGITNTALFRDITSIDEALKLWDKIQRDKKKSRVDDGSVVQMEDAEGNVMPEKVYYDLQKQGLL